MPYEGQTGTAPDGTKVVYRAGKVYPADQDPGNSGKRGMLGAPADVKTDLGVINAAKEDAASKLDTATKLERFLNLNKSVPTGPGNNFPILPLPGFLGGRQNFGDVLAKPFNPKYQEMEAITAQLTPSQRVAGSGPTSDYDARTFRAGLPSVDKFASANEGIYKTKRTDAVKANARAGFIDKWYAKTGSLTGGEQAFNRFWLDYSKQSPAGGAPSDPLGIRGGR